MQHIKMLIISLLTVTSIVTSIKLETLSERTETREFGELYFNIKLKHSNKCFDATDRNNGSPVRQHDCHGGDNQRFRLNKIGDKVQMIIKGNDMPITVQNIGGGNGAALIQLPSSGNGEQQFTMKYMNRGYFSLVSSNGKCLDIAGGSRDNQAKIHNWDCHGGGNQQVRFVIVE